jgi:hypothetical protein
MFDPKKVLAAIQKGGPDGNACRINRMSHVIAPFGVPGPDLDLIGKGMGFIDRLVQQHP